MVQRGMLPLHPKMTQPQQQQKEPPLKEKINARAMQHSSHCDTLLKMIQGPTITITLEADKSTTYTLPITLLTTNSNFFSTEIARLSSPQNKKRKLTPDTTTTTDHSPEMALTLDAIDPTIFGLFLKFLYTGAYPTASPLTKPKSQLTPLFRPDVPLSIHAWLLAQQLGAYGFMNHAMSHLYSGLGAVFTLTPNLVHHIWVCTEAKTVIAKSAASMVGELGGSGSMGTSVPVAAPMHGLPVDQDVEMGSGGGAASAEGAPSSLTPGPCTPADTSASVIAETKPSAQFCNVFAPSPLRDFIVDVLVVYWPKRETHPHVIARPPGMEVYWNALLSGHPDMRAKFIFGLQGGVQLKPVQEYMVPTITVAPTPVHTQVQVKIKKEGGIGGEGDDAKA